MKVVVAFLLNIEEEKITKKIENYARRKLFELFNVKFPIKPVRSCGCNHAHVRMEITAK